MNQETEKILYYADTRSVSKTDIENALRSVGLARGDIVMVHSDVGTFGKIGEVLSKDEFLHEIFEAFVHVIGVEGTLVVPTYTYSFCKGEIFDVKNSKPNTGIFADYIRMRKDAFRSEDPIFSHAGVGKMAAGLLKDVGNDCFGKDSFFERFLNAKGKIVNLGKFFDITFLHFIENKFGVNYRFNKKFNGTIISKDGRRRSSEINYYVRYLPEDGLNVQYAMMKLGDELEKRRLLKRAALGANFVLCCKTTDCFEVGMKMLRQNEYAFLKHIPNML